MRLLFLLGAVALSGCAPPPPNAAERAAAIKAASEDVPEPREHPKGIVAAYPPADVSAVPLRCWPNGQDTVCERRE